MNWKNYIWFAGNGIILLLSYPLIFIFEKTFSFLSDATLFELSDTNQPLLRRLAEDAPGSFQHSLQVANLAGEAARIIKANHLLVRTGALYHDIGKILNPEYYIENQAEGYSPHENLDPLRSSKVIINHVRHDREGRNHPWLAYPGVITQRELEEKIIHHPEEIAGYRDVVMIQCIRPETNANLPDYCSRVCCTNTMKNAIRLKLFNPGCHVSVLYKNIITYRFREEFYPEARRRGVVFIRYTDEIPPQISYNPTNGRLSVKVLDLSLNRWLALPADVIPLSMSILPADGTSDLANILHVPLSSEGFYQEAQLKLRYAAEMPP